MFPSVQLKKTVLLRLSKILSLSSVTSRNKAQELIKRGRVKVNKQVIDQNVLVDVKSDIELDGIPIQVNLKTQLWGIYKPKHVFCNTEQNYQYEEKKGTNKKESGRAYGHGNENANAIEKENENERISRIYKELPRQEFLLNVNSMDMTKSMEQERKINGNYSIDCPIKYSTKYFTKYSTKYSTKYPMKYPMDSPLENAQERFQKKYQESPYEISEEKKERHLVVKVHSLNQKGIEMDSFQNRNSMNDVIKKETYKKWNMNIFDYIRKKNILLEEKHKASNFIPEHLITINSLDATSEGLVLFTNDGDFANNLRNVENKILTCYLLKIQGDLNSEKLQLLKKGSIIDNTFVKPINIQVIKSNFSNNWIKFTYVEKSKIYINKLFEKFQLSIKKCKRISFGPYKASDLSTDFFMPLKIHSIFTPFIPTYKEQWILTQPKGNIQTDSTEKGQPKFLYVKDYLKNSLLYNNEKENIN